MSNKALYYDGSNWVSISGVKGPQGPPGPLATGNPTGAAGGDLTGTYPNPGIDKTRCGGLLAVQRTLGRVAGYRAIANEQKWFVDGGVTPLQITYTPPVPVFWEVTMFIGLVQKLDAAYTHEFTRIALSPTDLDGWGAATGFPFQMDIQHASVQTYSYRHMVKTYRLAAGTAYTAYAYFNQLAAGGSWQYYQDNWRISMSGAAWAA